MEEFTNHITSTSHHINITSHQHHTTSTTKISLLNRAENLVAEKRQEQGDQSHQEGTTQYGQLQALDIQDSQDEKQRRAKTER